MSLRAFLFLSYKKDPEEVSREILANSKLNAAITTYKETGKLPEGMQFAGRGADGKPIVICAESIEQIKHLDNYKILTTLLTQKGKNEEEKTFDGYATASNKLVCILCSFILSVCVVLSIGVSLFLSWILKQGSVNERILLTKTLVLYRVNTLKCKKV